MRKGSKMTIEARKKISDAGKGRVAWNKGLTKETDERVRKYGENTGKSLKLKYASGELINWNSGKKDIYSEEARKKMSEKKFIYGDVDYWHRKAYKLFGKELCELCNNKETTHQKGKIKRLSMHCKSIPKDYTILTKENWMCLCANCHHIIDNRSEKSQYISLGVIYHG